MEKEPGRLVEKRLYDSALEDGQITSVFHGHGLLQTQKSKSPDLRCLQTSRLVDCSFYPTLPGSGPLCV